MAKHYWSPSTRGFYIDEIHGGRTLLVDDPAWVKPEPVNLAAGEEPGAEPVAPLVEVQNPECGIPPDALEITAEEKAALMAGQDGDEKTPGRRIDLVNGKVGLVDYPVPTGADAVANLRATRAMRLAQLDVVTMRHRDQKDAGAKTTLTDAQFADHLKEKQRLRDITKDAAAAKDPWAAHLAILATLGT